MTDDRRLDRRLGPPPVEPMSDIAWSRVERGLWARIAAGEANTAPRAAEPARGSWRWWLIAAPLAAAAIIAIVVGLRVILPFGGGGELARVVSPPAPAAPSAVSFDDSHIELDPDTALAMGREAERSLVLLERGAAWFSVAPRRARPEFVVRAGDAVVRVIGTRFRVERASERIAVQVERGVVDVQFRGSVVVVAAGQRWSSESPGRVATLAAAPPATAPAASGKSEARTAASDEPDEIELPDQRSAAPARPKRAPRPVVKPTPEGATTPGPDPRPGAAQSAEIDRERAEYERLAALEPTSPGPVLAGYMVLARGNSRWADVALFAAGRLATDRHDPRAETLLGMYLLRFPGGPNAEDARRLLARVRADQSRPHGP